MQRAIVPMRVPNQKFPLLRRPGLERESGRILPLSISDFPVVGLWGVNQNGATGRGQTLLAAFEQPML